MKKIKEKTSETVNNVKTTLRGLEHFVLTLSLVGNTGFAIWGLFNIELRQEYKALLAFTTAVMVLFAGYHLVIVMKKLGREQ